MSDAAIDEESLLDLFRVELESQTRILTESLLALESQPRAPTQLEQCMRAAHSLKGAARIVGLDPAVTVAHAMEDCFVAAQDGRIVLHRDRIDLLLRGVDWLTRIAELSGPERGALSADLQTYVSALRRETEADASTPAAPESSGTSSELQPTPQAASTATEGPADRVLRMTAQSLNQLLGLAAESWVESRRLSPLVASLLRLRRMQDECGRALDGIETHARAGPSALASALRAAQQRVVECRETLSQQLGELERFATRAAHLSQRMYAQALASRMRPFGDCAGAFPRMVRDLGRELGKQVVLEIHGPSTLVDRDILEKLEAPLTHLLRNAVDHGVETSAERRSAGKPEQATIRLEASHGSGMLQISVSDDGRGISHERLRARIVERRLTNVDTAARLTDAELLDFLFLPGFTLRDSADEISGRGVGLDIVQHMIKEVRGAIRVHNAPGVGARFHLQLPLTLSVVRALLAEVGGQPYAFPLAQVGGVRKLDRDQIEELQGRPHFRHAGRAVSLVTAHQILGLAKPTSDAALPVIVIADAERSYGVVVERLLGEQEVVVQPLDARLGKVKDIAAGALTSDGCPVLVVDVQDLIRSVEKLATDGTLQCPRSESADREAKPRKRVLVVDDSLTVRELERKLLGNRGYEVEVAVDGMDGWNAVRVGEFDLVVTDVDMPRLDGVELAGLIRADARLQSLPILMVSYKDRDEDRQRGLEAGADYYLTKGSFHDDRLLDAVRDLIGEASA